MNRISMCCVWDVQSDVMMWSMDNFDNAYETDSDK